MSVYWLALGILGTWRLTSLLVAEDGPWGAFARLRRLAGDRWWAGLLDCFYCLSLWVAAPIALLIAAAWRERVLLWLALSAGAILIERLIPALGTGAPPVHTTQVPPTRGAQVPPATYTEDVENDNGLLRRHAATPPDRHDPARSR